MTATALTLTPAGLTLADLTQGRLFLEQTRDALTGSAKLVSPAQWTFKPRPDRWSIVENVEHVIAVQEIVIGMIRQQLPSAPPPPAEQDHNAVDAIVIHQIPSRLSKFPSPLPSTAELSKAEALRRYADNCAALSELLASTPGLREHAIDSPPLKAVSKVAYSVMDGYAVDTCRRRARGAPHKTNSRTHCG